uniref:PUM-HD domain-containing protein n=1 Tax=Setaria digitata TaxID=48799 RepID=A0A915PTG7_9BILA
MGKRRYEGSRFFQMIRKRKYSGNVAENCYWEHTGGWNSSFSADAMNSVSNNEFMADFEKRYGDVKCGAHSAMDFCGRGELSADNQQFECTTKYPFELVEYMKQVADIIKDDPSVSDDLQKKCLEECQGSEIFLFTYSTSCRLIDEIFNGCCDAAKHWMSKVMQSEKETLLQLLSMPWACHTLEILLSSLLDAMDIEVIDYWVDVVLRNWMQLLSNRNASHFIRTFIYHLLGLKRKKPENKEKLLAKDALCRKIQISSVAKGSFERIASVALDYSLMQAMLDDESVSLVLQDVIECDSLIQTGFLRRFVEAACEEPNAVREQWKGKFASRLWDIIVQKADEDLRQRLYHAVLEGRLFNLSLHMFANFPIQKYILSAKSDELVTDICDELIDHIANICIGSKWGVIVALARMLRNRDEVIIVRKLRNYFRCGSKSARSAFVPCVFTLTCRTSQCEVTETFDILKGQLHGSLILQELVSYQHNKTVVMSMKSLADTTIVELARDKKGSFLLQAFFKSSTILRTDKELIARPLKQKWHEVITDNVSSRVFDVLWVNGLYNIHEKEELMDALSKTTLENHCKTLRLMCKKLDVRGFREQRKKWLKEATVRFNN